MKEIWKDVLGYEGLYQVSNLGRLKSYDRIRDGFSYKNGKTTKRFYVGKIMKLSLMGRYYATCLRKDGKYKTNLIHRLVAIAFIDNPLGKPNINHIDFDTSHNFVSNLEWCTQLENIHHTINNGRSRQLYGEENGMAKLKNSQIKEIFKLNRTEKNQTKIASIYNVHQSTINKILHGKIYNKVL